MNKISKILINSFSELNRNMSKFRYFSILIALLFFSFATITCSSVDASPGFCKKAFDDGQLLVDNRCERFTVGNESCNKCSPSGIACGWIQDDAPQVCGVGGQVICVSCQREY